jgi:hypothetical protein
MKSLLTPELIQAVVTVGTPLVIAAVKKLIPKIPSVWLPLAAPLVGVLVTVATNYAGAPEVPVLAGAIAGGLGVWLREAADQLKKAALGS